MGKWTINSSLSPDVIHIKTNPLSRNRSFYTHILYIAQHFHTRNIFYISYCQKHTTRFYYLMYIILSHDNKIYKLPQSDWKDTISRSQYRFWSHPHFPSGLDHGVVSVIRYRSRDGYRHCDALRRSLINWEPLRLLIVGGLLIKWELLLPIVDFWLELRAG